MPRKALTDRTLKALKPAPKGSRYEVMDAVTPGMGIRVTDKGHCSFIFIARYPGNASSARRALGEYGAITLEQARERARRWHDLIRKGIDPADEEARERQAEAVKRSTTFAAVAEDFIREKLPGERKGKDVEREIRRDLMPEWAELAITEISDSHIRAVIKKKVLSAQRPATDDGRERTGKVGARNLLALVKRFFRWVAAQGVYGLSVPPGLALSAKDLLGEDVSVNRDRILTDDEIFAFWRATGRLRYPVKQAYRMLLLAALRLREASDAAESEFDPLVVQLLRNRKDGEQIDWRQVPMDRLIWVIPKERMKGKKSGKKQARAHAVPLTPDILALLETMPSQKGKFVFSTTAGQVPVDIGTKIKKDLDRRMLRTLRAMAKLRGQNPEAVELEHWVNHDLRRTVRSNLSRLKVTEEAREAVLAHARPGIKGTYDKHDYFDEKREALELWAARLKSIVEPAPSNVVRLAARQ